MIFCQVPELIVAKSKVFVFRTISQHCLELGSHLMSSINLTAFQKAVSRHGLTKSDIKQKPCNKSNLKRVKIA